jgi:protein-arginine kinase activator protein McsA
MVTQLRDLQDWVRDHYQVDRTLNEQLAEAVAAEEYERAAKLRDELARRGRRA